MAKAPRKSQKDKNQEALAKTMKSMEKWKIKTSDDLQTRAFKIGKLLSVHLQKEINAKIDTPVNFTKNQAVWYKAEKVGLMHRTYSMGIKDTQDIYLSALIDRKRPTDKLVPVSKDYVNKEGNIKGLNSNLKNGNYVKVVQPSQTILINRKAKTRDERLIAIRKISKRKQPIEWEELSNDIVDLFQRRLKQ